MSQYKDILEKYNDYSKYNTMLSSLKELKKYNMILFDKILNYNFDRFIKFIKLLFLPFGILFIISSGVEIIDSTFHTHFSYNLKEIMSQYETAFNYILAPTMLIAVIMFVNMVYSFRKEYISFKYALYFSLFAGIIGSLKINDLLTNSIYTIAFILNIYAYFKYKNSLNIIHLPTDINFLCKNKEKIQKIKISKYDDYVSVNLYNYKEELFKVINNIKFVLIGISILGGIIFVIDKQNFNILFLLEIPFPLMAISLVFLLVITVYLYIDIINYIKTIKNEIEYCEKQL